MKWCPDTLILNTEEEVSLLQETISVHSKTVLLVIIR